MALTSAKVVVVRKNLDWGVPPKPPTGGGTRPPDPLHKGLLVLIQITYSLPALRLPIASSLHQSKSHQSPVPGVIGILLAGRE